MVQCIEFEKGCAWTSELYDLRTHIEKNRRNVKNRDNNDLMEQMERSEMLLQEKEKDLNHYEVCV